ncbi:protein phosphatase 2C domain-containing protein [Blautia sp.]
MWEVSNYTKTGERNRMEGLKCQDYVYYMERGDIQIITLADGTGTDDMASIGAENACKSLAELLAEKFEELYEMDKQLVRYNVITNVQNKLYTIAESYNVGIEKLHSTLLGIAIDNKTNRFLAVHLGDGNIGVRKKEKIAIMSYPENGLNRYQTYLTSQSDLGEHVRIIRNGVNGIKEFILMSDGWCEKMTDPSQVIPEEIFQKTDICTYKDDVSFIALKRVV